MNAIRPDEGWAIVHTDGRPWPFVIGSTFRTTRSLAIVDFGALWAHEGETAMKGWKRARSIGARCVRVRCEIMEQANERD